MCKSNSKASMSTKTKLVSHRIDSLIVEQTSSASCQTWDKDVGGFLGLVPAGNMLWKQLVPAGVEQSERPPSRLTMSVKRFSAKDESSLAPGHVNSAVGT